MTRSHVESAAKDAYSLSMAYLHCWELTLETASLYVSGSPPDNGSIFASLPCVRTSVVVAAAASRNALWTVGKVMMAERLNFDSNR